MPFQFSACCVALPGRPTTLSTLSFQAEIVSGRWMTRLPLVPVSPLGRSSDRRSGRPGDCSGVTMCQVASTTGTASRRPRSFWNMRFRLADPSSVRHHQCGPGGCHCQTVPLPLALLPLLLCFLCYIFFLCSFSWLYFLF